MSTHVESSANDTGLHVRLVCVLTGLVLLAVSLVGRWLRPDQADVLTIASMVGLAIAAVPVLIDALTSLKSDGFEATKYYMDQFVALAVLACFAAGNYVTGAIVATILILGQILEERATLGVEEAVNSLARLSRVKARKLNNDGEMLVDATLLQPGDRVRLFPGDTIPADGSVEFGTTTLDQKLITGESLPVDAVVGSKLFAGTSNLTGSIVMIVGDTGESTVLGRVKNIVEEAKSSRAPVMRLIDQYTRYYMPLVLIVAAFTLFFTRDLDRAISVVIVAMPCAFVLASPSAMVAALAVASRLGILVKSSRFFEVARGIDTVVFDKTGTLTTGNLKVVGVFPVAGRTEQDLLAIAGSLEARSTHPIARAILAEASARNLEVIAVENIEEVPGRGVRGGAYLVGRKHWLGEHGVAIPDDFAASSPTSALYLAEAGAFAGVIHLADTLRPEAGEATQALQRLGVDRCVMLTGDRREVAAEIAREAGIQEYRAECLPEEKLREVEKLKTAGRSVLVVGDGVNDAPALAAGHLSIAMGALGSDIAVKTADIALMGSDLRNLPRFFVLSERTLRIINQNLLWGSAFIVLFVALSAAGVVSPIGAAILHEFSAFFVIFNSARLLRFDENDNAGAPALQAELHLKEQTRGQQPALASVDLSP